MVKFAGCYHGHVGGSAPSRATVLRVSAVASVRGRACWRLICLSPGGPGSAGLPCLPHGAGSGLADVEPLGGVRADDVELEDRILVTVSIMPPTPLGVMTGMIAVRTAASWPAAWSAAGGRFLQRVPRRPGRGPQTAGWP